MIFFRLHGFGVQRAAGKTHGIGQILRVGVTLGGGEIKAACVAADARLDIFKSVLDQLGHPFGVNQELSCNTYAVDQTVRNRLRTHVGLHSACADHGNIHELLYVRDVLKVAVLRHVHRRMRPVPGVIRTVVGVEHIVARILQKFCSLFGLFHVSAYLYVILTGHSTLAKALHLGLYGIAQRNGVILAARFLDRLDDLGCETVAVLKAAAVLVGALVKELNGKLVKQIPFVHSVHLHAVHARITAKLCGLGKCLDDLVDLLLGHLGADDIVCPTRGLRAGRCKLVIGIQHGLDQRAGQLVLVQRCYQLGDCPGAAHACGQLNEQLCSRFMDLVHKLLELLEHLGILVQILAPEGITNGRDTGDDQTDVVLRALQKQLGSLLVKVAARQLKPTEQRSAAHGAHDDTVFDLDVANLPRRKQRLILGIGLLIHNASPMYIIFIFCFFGSSGIRKSFIPSPENG